MKIKTSNSMLTAVSNCETLASLRTGGYAIAEGDDPTKMTAGHCAHLFLEDWLLGHPKETCTAHFLTEYQPYSDAHVPSGDTYHHENLVQVLELWYDRHPLEGMSFETLITEKEIEAHLIGAGHASALPSVWLVDRSDGIVKLKENGSLWAMEHKTTGANLTTDFKLAYRMDPQIMAHMFCWRSEGYDVKGVLMNVIRFSKVPKYLEVTKKGEPVKCGTHHIGINLCWQSHLVSEMFFVEPPQGVYEQWLVEQRGNAAHYRDLLLSNKTPGMQGLVNGTCNHCSFSSFCYKDRQAFELLVQREAPAWITRSGIYE